MSQSETDETQHSLVLFPTEELIVELLSLPSNTRWSVLATHSAPSWWKDSTETRGLWMTQTGVTGATSISQIFQKCDANGSLTGLVFGRTGAAAESTHDALEINARAVEEVSLAAPFSVAFADHLRSARRKGAIVFLTTLAHRGFVSEESLTDHVCSGMLASLTFGLAGRLASSGVRVNAIAVGAREFVGWRSYDGELRSGVPMGRPVTSVNIAHAVSWLLSAKASLLTGHVMPLDGGRSALAVPPVAGFPIT